MLPQSNAQGSRQSHFPNSRDLIWRYRPNKIFKDRPNNSFISIQHYEVTTPYRHFVHVLYAKLGLFYYDVIDFRASVFCRPLSAAFEATLDSITCLHAGSQPRSVWRAPNFCLFFWRLVRPYLFPPHLSTLHKVTKMLRSSRLAPAVRGLFMDEEKTGSIRKRAFTFLYVLHEMYKMCKLWDAEGYL